MMRSRTGRRSGACTVEPSKWTVGKLFFINDDLYAVTEIGEKPANSSLIPVKVEKVEFD